MFGPDQVYGEESILSKLTVVTGWSHIGVGEKDVIKMTDGCHFYARKVYSNRRLLDDAERSRRAQSEWNDLLYLSGSRFGVHVAKPVELLYENGVPVGLLTMWREGSKIDFSGGSSRIPKKSIDRLENNFDWLTDQGWHIESDDLSGIYWDGKDLWFPECRLFNQGTEFPSLMAPADEQLRWYPGRYIQTICSLRDHQASGVLGWFDK